MAIDRFLVDESHIMMFARAVGDPNPIYHDPEYAATTEVGHIIAPPTFAQSSAQFDDEYFLRPKPDQPWFGSGKEPSGIRREKKEGEGSGAAAGGLHAEQHFVYHRHLRPGDVLHAVIKPGNTYSKEGKRGGKLIFSETITEYYDADDHLVVTATGVGVRTEKVIEQG